MPFIKQRFDHTVPENEWSAAPTMKWKHHSQDAGFNTALNTYNESTAVFYEYESKAVFNDIMTMIQATDIPNIEYDVDSFKITIFDLPIYFFVSSCNINNWQNDNSIINSYYEKHIYCTTPQFDLNWTGQYGFGHYYPQSSNEYLAALSQTITGQYFSNDKLNFGYTLELYWNDNYIHMVATNYVNTFRTSLFFVMKGQAIDGSDVLYICSNPNNNIGAYNDNVDPRGIENWLRQNPSRLYGSMHKIINIADVEKATFYCIKNYATQYDLRNVENHYLWFQHNTVPMIFESKATPNGYPATDFLKPETRKKFLKRKPRCMGGLINFDHVLEGDIGIIYGNMYEIDGSQYYCPSDSAILVRFNENPLKYQQLAATWLLEL